MATYAPRIAQCARCRENARRPGQRWCAQCHAAYWREHRPSYADLTPEQRRKAACRGYANTYQMRGLLKKEPCGSCGAEKAEKHHDDYGQPLKVTWLCMPCHRARHMGYIPSMPTESYIYEG